MEVIRQGQVYVNEIHFSVRGEIINCVCRNLRLYIYTISLSLVNFVDIVVGFLDVLLYMPPESPSLVMALAQKRFQKFQKEFGLL